jgi:hypothetical protein
MTVTNGLAYWVKGLKRAAKVEKFFSRPKSKVQ